MNTQRINQLIRYVDIEYSALVDCKAELVPFFLKCIQPTDDAYDGSFLPFTPQLHGLLDGQYFRRALTRATFSSIPEVPLDSDTNAYDSLSAAIDTCIEELEMEYDVLNRTISIIAIWKESYEKEACHNLACRVSHYFKNILFMLEEITSEIFTV